MSEESRAEQVRKISDYIAELRGKPDHFALICAEVAEEAERMMHTIPPENAGARADLMRVAEIQLRMIRREFGEMLPEELRE